MATPIFRAKRASNSQDTVDYTVQRAARKNSSGNPGLNSTTVYWCVSNHISTVREQYTRYTHLPLAGNNKSVQYVTVV